MRMLIVERHKALRTIMQRSLSQTEGYRVAEADSASSAWPMIDEQGIDLVVCAASLADSSSAGLDLLRRCRDDDRFASLPFMLTVDDSTEHVIAQAIELDVDDVLIKPFSEDTLLNRVNDLVSLVNSAEGTLYRQMKKACSEDQAQEALSILDFIEELVQLKVAKWVLTKGKLKNKLGLKTEALTLFQEAIKACKLYVPAYEECGNILMELGDLDAAIEYLKKANALGCPNTQRTMKLCEACLKQDDVDTSKRILVKFINSYDGDKGQIIDHMAELYKKHGHLNDIEDLYSTILNKNDSFDVFNRIGIYFRQKGNYRESESCYLRALKLCPDSPVVYYNLGLLHHIIQNNTKAKYYLNKALTLDPGFKPALEAYASL